MKYVFTHYVRMISTLRVVLEYELADFPSFSLFTIEFIFNTVMLTLQVLIVKIQSFVHLWVKNGSATK